MPERYTVSVSGLPVAICFYNQHEQWLLATPPEAFGGGGGGGGGGDEAAVVTSNVPSPPLLSSPLRVLHFLITFYLAAVR